jgi:hypothetical protein
VNRLVLAVFTGVAIGLGLAGTLMYRISESLERRPDPIAGGWARE